MHTKNVFYNILRLKVIKLVMVFVNIQVILQFDVLRHSGLN